MKREGETTRLKLRREVTAAQRQFEADVALFSVAVAKAESAELLDGLAWQERLRARETARRLQKLDSSARQARVARAFGVRDDAPARLRELFSACGPVLQRQMFRQLPPYLKTTFPALAGAATQELEASCPARAMLAERLIREATR